MVKFFVCVLTALLVPTAARAQDPPVNQHDMQMAMPMDESGWMVMQDGVVFGVYNHQGGPRGGNEVIAPTGG